MENIKLCCECNCELLPYEKYVCNSCRKMIEEYEREQQDVVKLLKDSEVE